MHTIIIIKMATRTEAKATSGADRIEKLQRIEQVSRCLMGSLTTSPMALLPLVEIATFLISK